MNNTKRTTLTIAVAILMAATIVVGGSIAATTGQSAFAYSPKKDDKKGNGNDNGNTITIQKCKQAATQSGWDNDQQQECENVICTHPGENATCVQEGAAAAETPVAPPLTPPVTPPTTREVCVGAPTGSTFLYNVVLDADLGAFGFLKGHTICLVGADPPLHTNPIGAQDAFDVQIDIAFFPVTTDQPNQATCTPPFVHATVRSGTPFVGQIPLTQVCIRPGF